MPSRCHPTLAALLATGLLAVGVAPARAAPPQVIAMPGTGLSFEVPAWCDAREGPGTIEAVCDPEGDSDKSRAGEARTALYFELSVALAPDDLGAAPDVLAARYPLATFRDELPDAVCGEASAEARSRRVRVEGARQATEAGGIVYAATVTCPEIRFLALGPRRAQVRVVMRDGRRVRIMARALGTDFDRAEAEIAAFFKSLKLEAPKAP